MHTYLNQKSLRSSLASAIACCTVLAGSALALTDLETKALTANQLIQQGKFSEAEPLCNEALAEAEKTFGENSIRLVPFLSVMGNLYFAQGNFPKAEPIIKRALTISDKSTEPNAKELAPALHNLGTLYGSMGRLDEALELEKRGLKITETAYGATSSETAACLNGLGVLYVHLHKYADADAMFRRAGEIDKKKSGENSTAYAIDINNLAECYKEQKQFNEALPLFKHVLSIKEKVLGPDHPDVATTVNAMAVIYELQGNYLEAEPLYKRAIAIREKVSLDPNHMDVAQCMASYASMLRKTNRPAEAEEMQRKASGIMLEAMQRQMGRVPGAPPRLHVEPPPIRAENPGDTKEPANLDTELKLFLATDAINHGIREYWGSPESFAGGQTNYKKSAEEDLDELKPLIEDKIQRLKNIAEQSPRYKDEAQKLVEITTEQMDSFARVNVAIKQSPFGMAPGMGLARGRDIVVYLKTLRKSINAMETATVNQIKQDDVHVIARFYILMGEVAAAYQRGERFTSYNGPEAMEKLKKLSEQSPKIKQKTSASLVALTNCMEALKTHQNLAQCSAEYEKARVQLNQQLLESL